MGWRDSAGMRLGPRPWVWQLFFFVGACITVLLAFQAFRGPEGRVVPVSADEDALTAGPSVPAPHDTLADDEFRAPPPLSETPVSRPAARATPAATADIDLNPVKDATLGVRFDESDAFFDLLHNVARTPPEDLEAKVRYDVQYVNLMTDPLRYRGQAITIAGELQRLTPFTAASNRHRLQTLYEAWIVTPDSAPHAYRVVTTQLGSGIPVKPARLPVQVTGYFLKQEGYVSPAGVELAPVVLGAALDRDDTVFHPAGISTFPSWMVGLIVAAGLILTATVISMAVTERRSARLRPLAASLSQETLTELAALAPFSVPSFLRELEETEQARRFETAVRPTPTAAIQSPHVFLPKRRPDRGVELPTPTPPTRRPKNRWGTPGNEETQG